MKIVMTKVPNIAEDLARQICRFLAEIRKLELGKVPGISETLDWANAMVMLHHQHLDRHTVEQTLGCLIKDADDLAQLRTRSLDELLAAV